MGIFVTILFVLIGAGIGTLNALWWSFLGWLVAAFLHAIAPAMFVSLAYGTIFPWVGSVLITVGAFWGLVIGVGLALKGFK